jgi:hypothetical protein
MATLSKLTVGQVLYDVHSTKMGYTTMRRKGCWRVVVKMVDPATQQALCSWNGNAPRWYSERDLKKLRVKKPEPKTTIMGMPSY